MQATLITISTRNNGQLATVRRPSPICKTNRYCVFVNINCAHYPKSQHVIKPTKLIQNTANHHRSVLTNQKRHKKRGTAREAAYGEESERGKRVGGEREVVQKRKTDHEWKMPKIAKAPQNLSQFLQKISTEHAKSLQSHCKNKTNSRGLLGSLTWPHPIELRKLMWEKKRGLAENQNVIHARPS